jgi:RNA polymerase sigma factor (sigma-70 family)
MRAGGAVQDRSDEQLLVAIAAGPGALPEFYQRHVVKVMAMGYRRFTSPDDVADFVADVFVEVMTSAHSFDPRRGRAVPWLYGLAAHVAAAHLRRRARDADVQRQVNGRALLGDDDYARVEERIDAATALRHTYTAMQRLGDHDRRLLELVAVDGLAPAEAAAALGITGVAARVRLVRARTRLRTAIAAADPPPPARYATREGVT